MWKQFFFCMFMYMRATLGVLCVCVCVVYVVVAVALDRCEFPEISITHGRKKKTVAKEHHHLVVASNQESARGGKGRERERWEKSNNKKQQQQRAVCACFSFVLWIHEQQHSHFLYAGLKRNGSNEFNIRTIVLCMCIVCCAEIWENGTPEEEKNADLFIPYCDVCPLFYDFHISAMHIHTPLLCWICWTFPRHIRCLFVSLYFPLSLSFYHSLALPLSLPVESPLFYFCSVHYACRLHVIAVYRCDWYLLQQ